MSQTSYSNTIGAAFAGMKVDSRFDLVESFLAESTIAFGRGVSISGSDTEVVHYPVADRCIFVFDLDFEASNVITVTVNGTAAAAVTYATDHATTLAAVATAIDALDGVVCTGIDNTVEGGSIFTIETTGTAITVSETVTGGSNQATGYANYQTATYMWFSRDTEASNVIAVTVDGYPLASTTYATDNATTMAAVATKIQALSSVYTASAISANIIKIVHVDYDKYVNVAAVVTGGTNQATITQRTISLGSEQFRGIALHEHNENGYYSADDAVSTLRQGAAWVDTGIAVNADEDAYVDMSGGIGKFTNVKQGNLPTGGKFRSTVSAAGLAKVEINIP